jgi:hypothetical protein
MADDDLIEWLNKASVAIYAATDGPVADDISPKLREAASRLAALQSERDYAVGAMREAREYLNIETTHAREAEAQVAALQQRVEALERERQ